MRKHKIMEPDLNIIEGLLKTLKAYKTSPELDEQIIKAIENMRMAHEPHSITQQPFLFSFLTPLFMKTAKLFSALALVVVIAIGGILYGLQDSYASHLNKAKAALTQLEAVLQGNARSFTLLPTAMAADGVDEDAVADLTETVVEETEKAIEAAEKINEPPKLQEALTAISDVQEESVAVLAEAADVVQSEVATEVVAEALETTTEDQGFVEKALDFVSQAAQGGEDEVNVAIDTSQDEGQEKSERVVKAEERYEQAKLTLAQLKEAGLSAEDLRSFESFVNKVEAALQEGKAGRAFGLSTAMQARSKHLLAQAKIETENQDIQTDNENADEDDNENQPEDDKSADSIINEQLERAQQRYQEAQLTLEQLKAAGVSAEDLGKLEDFVKKIEAALQEGKAGRAFGLSTALQAKGKNMILKAKRNIEKEAKKTEKETERVEKKAEPAERDVDNKRN